VRISVVRRAKRVAQALLYIPLRLLFPLKPHSQRVADPKRILLLNGAHFGDLVISSSLLPGLQSAYPRAEIGLVCGSWAREVLRGHPLVVHTHLVDHWRLNRSGIGVWQKLLRYWRTRRTALREIRALQYDMAICLHGSYPDMANLAWSAAIPVRSAFANSIWAPLATVTARHPGDEEPFVMQGVCLTALLRAVGVDEEHIRLRRASLPPSGMQAIEEVSRLLGGVAPGEIPYSIIHMGSGVPAKELPVSFWRTIAEGISGGQRILFTGAGARETGRIGEILKELAGLRDGLEDRMEDRMVDAGGKLSWGGFVAAVRHAQAVYGLDSAAAHVAAAVGTPCFAVYSGIGLVGRWRPDGQAVLVWNTPVPCSPCHLPNGCAAMSCMKGVTPQDLLAIDLKPQHSKQYI
jgi:ADP-heptose:LPS heptosyltransferase